MDNELNVNEEIEILKRNDPIVCKSFKLHPDNELEALKGSLAHTANERDLYLSKVRRATELFGTDWYSD
jgi:hypothetical protein